MARGKSAYNRFAAPLLKAGVTMKEVARRWKAGRGSGGGGGGGTGARAHGVARRLNGVLGTVQAGAMASGWVLAGKIGSRAVPNILGLSVAETGDKLKDAGSFAMVAGVQLGAGVGIALLAEMLNPYWGELVMAGVFVGLEESLARKFSVPYVSTLAGDEGDALLGYTYEMSGEAGRVTGQDLERLARAGNMLGYSSYPAARTLQAYVQQ